MGMGIVYYTYSFKKIHRMFDCDMSGKLIKRTFIWYFIISMFYLALSYLNAFKNVFNLYDVQYSTSYVLRQGYLVLLFPMMISIIYEIYRKPNFWRKVFNDRRLLIFSWCGIYICRELHIIDTIPERPLLFALASMILCINSKSVISWGIMIVTILRGIAFFVSSSSLLATLAAMLVFVFFEKVVDFIKKDFDIKFWFLVLLGFMLVIVCGNFFTEYIRKDANSMWRLQYWVNEIRILKRTIFFGVGYGTAYASESIYREINNASVFTSQGNDALYIITQHNSIMNLLYRMGFIGLLYGIQLWVIKPLELFAKSISVNNSKYIKILKWGLMNYFFNLVIIITNPGLESPRFAMGFIITYSISVGFCLSANKSENQYFYKTLSYKKRE